MNDSRFLISYTYCLAASKLSLTLLFIINLNLKEDCRTRCALIPGHAGSFHLLRLFMIPKCNEFNFLGRRGSSHSSGPLTHAALRSYQRFILIQDGSSKRRAAHTRRPSLLPAIYFYPRRHIPQQRVVHTRRPSLVPAIYVHPTAARKATGRSCTPPFAFTSDLLLSKTAHPKQRAAHTRHPSLLQAIYIYQNTSSSCQNEEILIQDLR